MNSDKIDLSVDIGPLQLQNPIMPASGCFGYGEEANKLEGMDISRLGAIVSKGTTLEPRDGNPQPRIWETPCGMINRIGLQNPGIDKVIEEKMPFMAQFGVPVIINISGFTVKEFRRMAERLDEEVDVAAMEINISCPNVSGGKIPFGIIPEVAEEVVDEVKQVTDLPLIVKLTPNVTDIAEIAVAVESAGADAISLINTLKGSFISNGEIIQGGLSGPAIKPVALTMVNEVVRAVDIPVIGMGGIATLADVFEFIAFGASAVAVGTACFKNPLILMELIDELEQYCLANQIANMKELEEKIKEKK